jgi:hypothetical protein
MSYPSIKGKFRQIAHRGRWLKQFVARPELAVIGCYHYSNLGDMTLGETIAHHARERGVAAGLQTIYNLSLWRESKCGIVGGGAVAYRDSLRQLSQRYGRHPERLAILGVDFNEPAAVEESAEFLSRVAVITCRSTKQAAYLARFLNRPEIRSHLDLTFASPWSARHDTDGSVTSPRAGWGINCPPLFWHFRDGDLVLGNNFVGEMALDHPELGTRLADYANHYVGMVRTICRHAAKQGSTVSHIPFAPEDDAFARLILKGENIQFLAYDSSPARAYNIFRGFERFVAGRFHSLAFAIQTQTPCLPFCYASKSRRLLEDLGTPHGEYAGVEILADQDAGKKLLSLENKCLVVSNLQTGSREVKRNIDIAFEALGMTFAPRVNSETDLKSRFGTETHASTGSGS